MKQICLLLVILVQLPHQVTAVTVQINNNTSSFVVTSNTSTSISLKCDAQNHTKDETLNWYRGNRMVDVKSENSVNSSNVCIYPLTPSDNGVSFTCILKRNTTVKLSVILNVTFSPILSGEQDVTVEEGKNIKLTCGVQANPPAEMAWRQNGSIVKMVKSRFEQSLTSDTFQLSISKAEKSDAAKYTCIAVSTFGKATREFNLVVGDKKEVVPIEAIAAAVVVGVLTILFGLFARRDKIFKKCMKSRDGTSL
ncbi:transmembrane and immunoglobulin domain-containing protein 1 isoform 1-T2 [Discoglossus pictus]